MSRDSFERMRVICEGMTALCESITDPEEREQFERGPLATIRELAALEWADWLQESFGHMVLGSVALARPMPSGRVRVEAGDVLMFGPEHAQAILDLDRGRGPPSNAFGSIDRGEALQRLGDFIASEAADLHGVARHACFGRGTPSPALCTRFLEVIDERWPAHLMVTLQRWGLDVRDKLVQRERASVGGRTRRRPRSAAARLVAAVLDVRPMLRGQTFGAFVAALQNGDPWGDVSIENMTIAFGSGGPGKRGRSAKRTWAGTVVVYAGEERQEVTAKALESAFERARRNP